MEVCGGQTHTIVKQGIDEALPRGRAHDPRPRLPGLRHPARAGGQGAGHRRPPGRHLHQLRRHAARPRLLDGPARPQGPRRRRAHRLHARSTRSRSPSRTRSGRSCSSPSASRPPRPRTRWRSPRPPAAASTTSASSSSHVLVPPAMTALLDSPDQPGPGASWPPATCARSWAGPSTSRSPRSYRVPIVVTGFEPLDLLEGILHGHPPARGGPVRGREPVHARRDPRGRPARPAPGPGGVRDRDRERGAASARSRCPATACVRSTRGSTPS